MDAIAHDHFVASAGQVYRITSPVSFDIRLAQVSPVRKCGPLFESFSLLFNAERGAGILQQGTYEVSNETVGAGSLFVTPVQHSAGEPDRQYYEAVFTRRVDTSPCASTHPHPPLP